MSDRAVRVRVIAVLLACAAPLLRSGFGDAQEAPPGTPTFQLPEIEIAGDRPQLPSTTPADVSVITSDEIAAMGALTVADALRLLPELFVKGSGGPGALTTVSIRGSSSTQVLVLLDGVPLNRPDQPSVDLSTLPIQNVDHIEVLRGPFSALYGSSALGGVINIVTKSAPRTSVSARVGSFGESANVVSAGGTVSNLTYLVQGILTGSTGFAPDTDYGNSTVMAKFHWKAAQDAGWTLTLNRLWHVVGTPGPLGQQDLLARTWEGRTVLDLTWQQGRPDGPGSLFRVYTLDDDVSFLSPGMAFQSEDTARVWGVQAQAVRAPWPGHLVTFGVTYEGQSAAHMDNTPSAFGNADNDLALYVEDDWRLSPRVLLSTGVRGDVFQLYGTQINPRAGVVVLLSRRLLLRASAGRTFRAPSFDEIAPSFNGNPNLLPEIAWSYDMGLAYTLAPGLTAALTGYYTDATNLITSSPPLFVPMNVGHAVVTGGSIEVAGRLSDRWFVRANYTNQRARDAATGLDVIYVPRQLATLEVTYRPARRTSVNLIVSYTGDVFNDPADAQLVPGYWLTSLTVNRALGNGFTLQAGVANAFDVTYQTTLGFPEPGRRYFVTMTRSF